ncbi:MAG: DUF5615 family PIN-like protein [Nitrospirae bacterium]|nr:DUF5615 family PIN-like protein [Nitrospirota bacterium]
MKVKLDENLGLLHVAILKEYGHEVDRVTDEGLSGSSDNAIWEKVCAAKRFFITLDTDFSDIRKFPPKSHPGILLLRPKGKGKFAVERVLRKVLKDYSLDLLSGCLTVADEEFTRIRS